MDILSRIFWIDAICIDQGNRDERSKQVAFMSDIYNEAMELLVWLGEESSASRVAFAFVQSSYKSLSFLRLFGGKRLSFRETVAVRETFEMDYWHRLWVVQELYHAQRIMVRSGSLEIDWEDICQHLGHIYLSKVSSIETYRRSRKSRESWRCFEDGKRLGINDNGEAVKVLNTWVIYVVSIQKTLSTH
jgi:hypothetical protein